MKLTQTQVDLLTLIVEHTTRNPDGSLARFWWPPNPKTTKLASGKVLVIDGAGIVASLKSLDRRGYIKKERQYAYAYSATEDGVLALEQHREKTGHYA